MKTLPSGDAQGGAALLWGGAAARSGRTVLVGARRVAAWGEPARPGLPPEGETEKGEIRLPCCRRLGFLFRHGRNSLGAPAAWTALEHVAVVEHAIEHGTDRCH